MARELTLHSSNGRSVKLRPVSPDLILAIRRGVKLPPVPTYDVAGKPVAHTQESINDQLTPEIERVAWANYLVGLQLANAEYSARRAKAFIWYGVDVDVPDTFAKDLAEMGAEVPNNARDLKYLYVVTEYLPGVTDLAAAIRGIELLSGLSKEELAKADEFFRCALGGDTAE